MPAPSESHFKSTITLDPGPTTTLATSPRQLLLHVRVSVCVVRVTCHSTPRATRVPHSCHPCRQVDNRTSDGKQVDVTLNGDGVQTVGSLSRHPLRPGPRGNDLSISSPCRCLRLLPQQSFDGVGPGAQDYKRLTAKLKAQTNLTEMWKTK